MIPGSRARGRFALLLSAALLGSCSVIWSTDQERRSPQLERYIAAHYDELGRQFIAPMSRQEFESRLATHRVLFLGDHHRDGAASDA